MPNCIQTFTWWALCLCLCLASSIYHAQAIAEEPEPENTLEQIKQGLLSSFDVPLSDLLKPNEEPLFDQVTHLLSGNISFNFPLQNNIFRSRSGKKSQGVRAENVTLSTSLRYNPLGNWFFNTNFYYYFDEKAKASWSPDFTYTFGYEDWRPYTLSLVYSNYDSNRFSPNRSKGERFTRIEQGSIALGWKYKLPRHLEELFIVHPSGSLRGAVNYSVVPHYRDLKSPLPRHWKQSFSCNLHYVIYKELYGSITFHFYPEKDQQQPWDPDFTYSFGMSDKTFGNLSLAYNNYTGNRFPWKKSGPENGDFLSGGISVSWSWNW